MSLVPLISHANPDTPCWVPAGGGGGGGTGPTGPTGPAGPSGGPTGPTGPTGPGGGGPNLVVDTIAVNQGGNITIGSSISSGTDIQWNKALDGSTNMTMYMEYQEPAGSNLILTLADQSNFYDSIQLGNVYAYGQGVTQGGAANQILMGSDTGFVGIGLKNGSTGVITPYLDICGNDLVDLKNVQTINGSPPGGGATPSHYDYVSYLPSGLAIPALPSYATLNTIGFTASVTGFAVCSVIARVDAPGISADTGISTFNINGTVSTEIDMSEYYPANPVGYTQSLNNQTSFPIVAGTPYTVDFLASSGNGSLVTVASKLCIIETS